MLETLCLTAYVYCGGHRARYIDMVCIFAYSGCYFVHVGAAMTLATASVDSATPAASSPKAMTRVSSASTIAPITTAGTLV